MHDPAAITHYRDILTAAHDVGVSPWVCLHHFTLPRWFLASGGFLTETNRTEIWRRHVDFVAETFGDLAAGWQPINETNYYARAAYGGRGWPPGHTDPTEVAVVNEAIHLANAEASVRLTETGSPVTSIFGLSPIVPQDDDEATVSMAQSLYEYFWAPWIGLFRDGVLRVPHREPIERPDLVGFVDMIGFSYYGTMGVREGRLNIHPPDAPLSPLGYGIWAGGLGLVLDQIHEELPDTPILVAEYGIGTDDDALRADYLAQGLDLVHDAIARGIDVRGLFHWTAIDNYEWLHGYDVSFGLMDRDPQRATERPCPCSKRRSLERRPVARPRHHPGRCGGHDTARRGPRLPERGLSLAPARPAPRRVSASQSSEPLRARSPRSEPGATEESILSDHADAI